MRSVLWVILVAGVAGTCLGVGLNFADLSRLTRARPLPPAELVNDARLPPLPPADGPQPIAVVEESTHDFGVMERDAKNTHVFVIKNSGGYPLVLRQGDTTCKCTMSKLAQEPIDPGEQADITLTWEAKSDSEQFRQTAEILTNDPQRPRVLLTIEGRIRASLAAMPPTINFSGMLESEERTATTRVYTTRGTDFRILEHSFSDPATAEKYSVALAPLSPEELQPLGFSAGYLVTLSAQSGLPMGEMRQSLLLHTNLEGAAPVEIPILGVVAGPVSVIGRGWKTGRGNRGILQVGAVKRGEVVSRELKFLVRGERRKQMNFTVRSVRPEALRASLGTHTSINEDTVEQVPLVIEVPAECPPFRLLGATDVHGEPIDSAFAEIVVECDDPQVGSWHVMIKLAVGAG